MPAIRPLPDFHTLWEFFQEHDVQFISPHEKFDSTGAVGRAMLKLILVFAELEREQTAERTKATMSHRARQGLWNGGSRFGYDRDPAQKGVLVVNPEHARIVREHFFKKCVELGSAGKVTTHLQRVGLREPKYLSRQGRDRGGEFFDKQKVIRVLTDPVYLGKIEWEGELHPGRHERVIDDPLFDEVQAILARNRERRGNYRDQRQHVSVLQGLVRCGRCGGFLTPKTSTGRGGKKHFYYVCTTANHTNGGSCDLKYVPADAAEKFVLGELKKWAMTPAEVERVVREANGRADATLGGLFAEEEALRRRLAGVQGRIDPLVTAIENRAGYGSVKDRLAAAEAERASVEGELAGVKTEIELLRQHALSLDAVAATYSDFPAILDALRLQGDQYGIKRLIGMFVEVIEWHQDAADTSKGRVDIQLFEQARPDGDGPEQYNPDATPVNSGASGCIERLPR